MFIKLISSMRGHSPAVCLGDAAHRMSALPIASTSTGLPDALDATPGQSTYAMRSMACRRQTEPSNLLSAQS